MTLLLQANKAACSWHAVSVLQCRKGAPQPWEKELRTLGSRWSLHQADPCLHGMRNVNIVNTSAVLICRSVAATTLCLTAASRSLLLSRTCMWQRLGDQSSSSWDQGEAVLNTEGTRQTVECEHVCWHNSGACCAASTHGCHNHSMQRGLMSHQHSPKSNRSESLLHFETSVTLGDSLLNRAKAHQLCSVKLMQWLC